MNGPIPTPRRRSGRRGDAWLQRRLLSSGFAESLQEMIGGKPASGPPRNYFHLVVRRTRWSSLSGMAAALSYRTVFGIIPVLVIGLVVLGAFATEKQMSDVVHRVLDFAGLADISVGDAPTVPDAIDPSAAATVDPGASPESARLEAWIESRVRMVRKIPFGTIGLTALAMLIYAAISMLIEVERTFNRVCNVYAGRSWARRVTQYWTLLTLGTLCLIASFSVGEAATRWVERLAVLDSMGDLRSSVVAWAAFAVTVLISTGLFVIVYTTVPNTRIQFMPALAGALLAAVLWEAGKWGFTLYVHQSAGYSRLYGSIALVPLFLLWVYVTWVIVLLGLQFAHTTQMYRLAKAEGVPLEELDPEAPPAGDARLVDPATIITLMVRIGERFGSGRPAGSADLAAATRLEESLVADMLEALADAGLVHRVIAKDEDGYALARPPESISLDELLGLGYKLADRGEAGQRPEFLARLRGTLEMAARGVTLRELLPKTSPPGAPMPAPSAAAPPPGEGQPLPAGAKGVSSA